jgi:hypothetical protein
MSEQVRPKWLGDFPNQPKSVETNPYSEESYELSSLETTVYRFVKVSERKNDYKNLRKGLDWFRRNNAKAYMVLLD